MENIYNNAHVVTEKPMHQNTGNQGIWNQGYVKSNKAKNQSGIHNIEFDSSSVKQKSPPNKDRPPFGHRPLSTDTSKTPGSEFIVGKAMSRPGSGKPSREGTSSSLGKGRPTSGRAYMTPVNTTSIGAYLQMKKSGKLNHLPTTQHKTTGKLNLKEIKEPVSPYQYLKGQLLSFFYIEEH